MKVRELIERLQTMEQDATVTVEVQYLHATKHGPVNGVDESEIVGLRQIGSGFTASVRLDPEDELKLA